MRRSRPLLHWPGWNHLRYAALISLPGSILFETVYWGMDGFTARRLSRVRIDFGWEQQIPFIPDSISLYLSLFVLLGISPFVLRDRRSLLTFALSIDLAIVAAAIGFALVPAELVYPVYHDKGHFPLLFDFADRLNLTYNLVPSLHVTFAVICARAFTDESSLPTRAMLLLWCTGICISTLVTHQHHVVDVVTGIALGLVSYSAVKTRMDFLSSARAKRGQ